MAKKHKKRKKLTRRARRESGITAPPKKTVPIEVAPEETKEAPMRRPIEPVGVSAKAPERKEVPISQAGTTVRFTDASRERSDGGIDADLAAVEYPAVRRDLRKLGLTIVFFAAVIAVLAVLNAHSAVVGNLGKDLFSLWR